VISDWHSPLVIYKSTKVRYFRIGRHARIYGLNILRLLPGDVVLVPPFICRDLLVKIHTIKATPLFYEFGPDIKPLSLPDVHGLLAVLAVNYFGLLQNLALFLSYRKYHDTLLVEENAHGYLSCDETGSFLGARGDLGILVSVKRLRYPMAQCCWLINRPCREVLSHNWLFVTRLYPCPFGSNEVYHGCSVKQVLHYLRLGKV